jgi:hypothetical protein
MGGCHPDGGQGRSRALSWPVVGMEWIEPVGHRKVIRDCRIDGGVESYQTVDDEFVVNFLKSLGLSHLTPRMRLAQVV